MRLMIAGLPRCGTTLLASLLNQQRGCRFVTDYVSWFQTACDRLDVAWDEPLSLSQRRVCLAMARDSWIRLRHPVLVTTDDFSTIDELHGAIAGELLGNEARAIGHKALLEPRQMELVRASTDIELIVMARDPRPAALSYWHRVGEGIEGYIASWKDTVRYASGAGPGVTFLRFEDLVLEPLRTLSLVTQLWGEKAVLPAEMSFDLGPSQVAWKENSAFGDVEDGLDPTPLDRWRRDARSPIVRYADAVCRDEMTQLGYDALHDHGRAARSRLRIHELVWAMDQKADTAIRRLRRNLRRRLAPPLHHA